MNFNLIKKIAGAVVLMLMFTINANAQDKGYGSSKVVTEHLNAQLSLNESQHAKVFSINQAYFSKAIENKESGKSQVEKAKTLKALDTDRDTKLKSVLSAAQYKTYVANKAENRKLVLEQIENK